MIDDSKQITIEPLSPSPIFVWSGETLFSNLDFIVDGNDVLIVDIDKVIREVKSVEKPEEYKEFLRELLEKYKQTGQYTKLLRELYGVKLEFKNVITSGNTVDQILNINPNIIPASEVKGLIRTAVINELLKSDNKVFNETMKRILDEMNKSNLKNIGRVAEQVVKVKLPTKTEYDALKTLLISDPIVESAKFGLNEIKIFNLKGGRLGSIYAITFTGGKLIYEAKIVKPNDYGVYKNSKIKDLDDKIRWDKIRDSLMNFSKVVIDDETLKINEYMSYNQSNKKDLNKYWEFLKSIKNIKDCIPLRIGMFTGHVAKTIEVSDNVRISKDIKKKREELLSKFYGKRWDNSTLKITGGVGLGWMKMCIK